MQSAIAYVRVSTGRQGRSGLGLAAQQAAITDFVETEGFDLIQTFTEIETGKGADALERRPQLAAALKVAKKPNKAPIIVAKLDRLSRDVHFFISGLMAHKTPFIVTELGRNVDCPSLQRPRRPAITSRTRRPCAVLNRPIRGVLGPL